ncbi:MAG: hypothetical protein KA436_09705 [Oligoflexales bacterium]|nr:hypothetical protein [Oligoflexales bacterium]
MKLPSAMNKDGFHRVGINQTLERRVNRRFFSKLISFSSLAFYFQKKMSDPGDLLADEIPCDIKNNEEPIWIDAPRVRWFLSGLFAEQKVTLALCIRLNLDQRSGVAIEGLRKLVLTDEQKNTLAVRVFPMQQKKTIYTIFHDISLPYQRLDILLHVEISGAVVGKEKKTDEFESSSSFKIYKISLSADKLRPSQVRDLPWPSHLLSDLGAILSSPVLSPLDLHKEDLPDLLCEQHPAKKRVVEENFQRSCTTRPRVYAFWDRKRSGNTVDVLIQNQNYGQKNVLRYILITDPVGNLLSVHKRASLDFHDQLSLGQSGSETLKLGLKSDEFLKVAECPYLLLFYECVGISLSFRFISIS